MEPLKCAEIEYTVLREENDSSVIKLNLPYISDDQFPTVSIVTPTYNRGEFFELIMRNWKSIEYPREKLELIILDDSEVKQDSSMFKKDPRIKYYTSNKKLTIGKKRNLLCKYANNEYIVHMDDDDWYVPESVACRIRALLNFEKKIGKYGCFGCNKVLCLDLLSNQMFEAYDESIDGTPSTIGESTLAYSKKYWNEQNWDDLSTITECLPFVKNRHDTLCVGPSAFVIIQFSHVKNTVKRRIKKTVLSEKNFIIFEQNMSLYDSTIFNNLRAKIISKIPVYRDSLEFIKENYQNNVNIIKRKYKYLDTNIKKNPLIIDFIQEKFVSKIDSTGKDIVYYCGPGKYLINTTNEWNPESKLGGSEESVVNLSKNLVKKGFNVTVYCILKGKPAEYDGVKYMPYYEWIPKDKQDITIIWRDPSNCNKNINSKKIFLDIHDVLNPLWFNIPSNIVLMTKSNFHKNLFNEIKNKKYVIPNGIYKLDNTKQKKENLMICTSSPERCLNGLLKSLPLIRKEIPNAEIHWAYGFSSEIEKDSDENNLSKNWFKETKELINKTDGFKELGRLTSEEVKKLYEKADLFIYPTYFPEIDCISLTKAMSAGCVPVVSNSGSLVEKMGLNTKGIEKLSSVGIDYSLHEGPLFDEFVNNVIKTLKSKRNRNYNMNNFEWDYIVDKWIKLF